MSRPSGRPGPAPLSGWRRLVRVGVLGGTSLGLAVCAHVAGGGGAPSWALAVGAVVLLGAAAAAATRRQRRFGSLVALLALQQVALHLVMSLGDGPAAMCSPSGHGHHDMAMTCVGAGSAPIALPSLPMLLAHLLAVLVTAWFLARGEAWLWRILRRAFRRPEPVCGQARPRLLGSFTPVLWLLSRQCRPAAPRGPPGRAALRAA